LKYESRKVFVTFLDGHELIYYHKVDYPTQTRYYLEWKMDNIDLNPKEMQLVQVFFDNLVKFNFVRIVE
jgi:hypothetical protein